MKCRHDWDWVGNVNHGFSEPDDGVYWCTKCGAVKIERCLAGTREYRKPSCTQNTSTNKLKAEIAAIADSVEDYTTTGADAGTIACIVRDLRQLSAV